MMISLQDLVVLTHKATKTLELTTFKARV
jgi:hypothetical protein